MSYARAFLQIKVAVLQAPSFLQRGSHLTVHAPSEEQDTLSTAALVLSGWTLTGCWAPASCLPLPEFTLKLAEICHVSSLPPKLKFSHSWRTASHLESIKNDLFISQFAFQPQHPILGFPAVVSCAASYLPWLNADDFCPDLFSRLSLPPWARGFVSICSVLCVQADRADCWFLHQWLFERPPASEQITGSTLSPICLLPGLGDYFPQWTILSLTFLPLRALQPPPRWDTRRPARFSSPALPCPTLWLPPSCPWSAAPPRPPQVATISLTLGCAGKMCDLEFTPNAGAASCWG